MKGRKKVEKTESMSKQEQIRTYTTNDNQKFEIDYESFKRVSPFVKTLESEATTFAKIDAPTMKSIIRYIEIRRDNPEIRPIECPLQSTDMSVLVEKPELQLLVDIHSQGWAAFEKVLEAAVYLEIDFLRELMHAWIAIEIISKDKETLKADLGIKDVEPEDSEKMKEEMRAMLKQMKK